MECEKCGAFFDCEIEDGKDTCWCMKYESVDISIEYNKCLCVDCLKNSMEGVNDGR